MDKICFNGKCINLQLRELIPQKLILLQQVAVHWKWFCWLFNVDIWPNVYISAQRQYRTGCIQHASQPHPPPILTEEICLKNKDKIITHKQKQSNAFEIPLPIEIAMHAKCFFAFKANLIILNFSISSQCNGCLGLHVAVRQNRLNSGSQNQTPVFS